MGLDFNSTAPDATTVATAAIPKSWALEFDEQVNDSRDGGDNNGFDYNYINTTTQHIASNYPAQASTYSRNGTATSGAKYFYYLNHQGKINTTLSDGTWHHLTLAWTAPTDNSNTGSMTYTFNDKNPTTGASQSGQSATISLDLSKLGINVTDATKTVTWGFTGCLGPLALITWWPLNTSQDWSMRRRKPRSQMKRWDDRSLLTDTLTVGTR
ncbi:hypothetical protein L3X07_07330 [Levilactobacillus brevis]|nr:hypothetical protein [Levilactobacillus brevis]